MYIISKSLGLILRIFNSSLYTILREKIQHSYSSYATVYLKWQEYKHNILNMQIPEASGKAKQSMWSLLNF